MNQRWLLALAAAGLLSGCAVLDPRPSRGYGPPAHAPAHGYRRHHGYDMDFDPGLGVYLVIGHPGYYFWDDHYWRLIDGHWHWGLSFGGPWRIVEVERVPHGLYKRHPGKAHKKGYEHGHDDGHREHKEHGRDKHDQEKSKGKDKGKKKGGY